jgi:MOSC domain-containing protein YiiM
LNIIALEMAAALGAEGYKAAPGELGEQITVTGLDIDALAPGTRLRIGDRAEVELIEMRTGCDWFEEIHTLPRPDGRLGMMCRVTAGGPIAVGDPVSVLVTES